MKKPQSLESILTTAKEAKGHFRDLQSNLASRISWLKTERDKESQSKVEDDFANVLAKWGIDSPKNIPDAIFALKIRIALFAFLPVFYGLFCLFMPWVTHLLVLAIFSLPCLFGILTACWRIWILKHAQFVPLGRWCLQRFTG